MRKTSAVPVQESAKVDRLPAGDAGKDHLLDRENKCL